MRHPDYAARASHAETQAKIASSPRLAEAWNHIADWYRTLDDPKERLNLQHPEHWADFLAEKQS